MEEGIYLIDKPQGWTSHDVVAKVRRITGIKRVGHAGTLDPLATGLLIVLVGREFTKRQPEFMKLDKKYECTAQLGVVTDTYDSNGKVIAEADAEDVKKITEQDIISTFEKFRGLISQTVPAYSAVKVEGRKLYARAREGQKLEGKLPSRQITIHELELINFDSEKSTFSLNIHCGSGTYIRSLVHDIGQLLGVGATVIQLRRTRIGDFTLENVQPLL